MAGIIGYSSDYKDGCVQCGAGQGHRSRTGGEPVERYLTYLTYVETVAEHVKAYAHELKDWFVFPAGRGIGGRSGWRMWTS